MAFNSSSYLQPDGFRDGINAARERSAMDAFNLLNASSSTDEILQRSFDKPNPSVDAFRQSGSFAAGGIDWLSSMNSALSGISASNAASGLERASTAASRAEELRASEKIYKNQKAAAEAAEDSSTIGSIVGAVGTVASLFCERRLKTDIAPIDSNHAWATIRDLPLYSFHYRHNPTIPAYGPMVDEVRQVDPGLLVPMDEQARHLAIADGEPIYGVDIAKRDIYESAALQQALQRIEQLEARLARLEGASAQVTPLPFRAAVPIAA